MIFFQNFQLGVVHQKVENKEQTMCEDPLEVASTDFRYYKQFETKVYLNLMPTLKIL
jgi:hypothetical protein